ncbi:hypothetical protein WS93_17730 [Burkholderia cepacia]|nr:hypothetical protein WS93_17730 [Burkholderia cepacia]
MVKAILRFFDTNKGRGVWILHQQEIRKNLQCAIRHLAGIEWVGESTIIELQENSFVLGDGGADALHTWYFGCDTLKNCFKAILMLAFHVLDDVPNVVAMDVKVALSTGRRNRSRCIRMEVR